MKTIPFNSNCTYKSIFDSSMLEIGEMMELYEQYKGFILLRTYNGFVCLNNPKFTWKSDAKLSGRKLYPGEGITLVQE